jgi:putative transposase
MPRTRRVVYPGCVYHITQRGNDHMDVFLNRQDYMTYIVIAKKAFVRFDIRLLAFCLMTNHIHLLAIPGHEDSLGKGIGNIHFKYARYFNRRHGHTDHVWKGRFSSVRIEENDFWDVALYVEQNPMRAGLCPHALDYTWSSARTHCTADHRTDLLDLDWWRTRMDPDIWRRKLDIAQQDELLDRIRRSTAKGEWQKE